MGLKVKRIWMVLAMLSILIGVGTAETYHLSGENSWENAADTPEGEYLLAVSKIKQQLLTGKKSDVVNALEQLKSDFPEMAGAEIQAYLDAEKLYANAKWYKAATAYKKFIGAWPDSILQPAALERVFSIATAYLQGQKRSFVKVLRLPAFDTGVELMRDVADRAGNAPIGLRALTTLAENQERKEQFVEAYYTWQEIADRWPTGQTRQTAVLRMAQTLHASYDGAPYDASVLESARSYFEDYQMQYPQEASRLEVAQTLALITEQLAYKEYEMGFYYERTGSMAAAEQYYNKVIKEWPDSKAAQMAKARLLPDAASPIKMNIRRRAVNGTTNFLDSWFGVESLFDKVLPADEDKSEISPDVLDDGMVVDEYIELDDGMIVDEYIEMSP
ncbi:MAG: tetratricopeptide repeat protein [Planctomycetota bacterium]|jgi:outer membrane protein assembly factor BamD